jgi:hypothetical protein
MSIELILGIKHQNYIAIRLATPNMKATTYYFGLVIEALFTTPVSLVRQGYAY